MGAVACEPQRSIHAAAPRVVATSLSGLGKPRHPIHRIIRDGALGNVVQDSGAILRHVLRPYQSLAHHRRWPGPLGQRSSRPRSLFQGVSPKANPFWEGTPRFGQPASNVHPADLRHRSCPNPPTKTPEEPEKKPPVRAAAPPDEADGYCDISIVSAAGGPRMSKRQEKDPAIPAQRPGRPGRDGAWVIEPPDPWRAARRSWWPRPPTATRGPS